MKKLLLLSFLSFFIWSSLSAQIAPVSVCTYPSDYNFDEEVSWYFDLTGNSMVTPGQDLYLWMWEPVPIPGGPVILEYLRDMTWSITFTPTELLNVELSVIQDAGNSAFWCHIENASRTTVTGTIPYEQKELLRQGLECSCVGVPSEFDDTYFVNFGSSPVADPDASGFYWTNIQTKNQSIRLIDTLNVHRYDISCSGDFTPNNNSDFTIPDPAILGNMAIQQATESYMYLSSGSGTVTISCLELDRLYKLSVFGSRNTTSVRESKYTISGFTTESGVIQTSGPGIASNPELNCNDDEFFVAEMYPANNGTIEILVEIQSGDFAYINMLKIEEVAHPDVIEITNLEIDASSVSTTGPSVLSLIYTPENTNQNAVNWSVNDESIAVIDVDGTLKPRKEGTVRVIATSVFNSEISDEIDVTFSNLLTSFYISGLATEALSEDPPTALPMRMVIDPDSTITNLFEIFTSLNGTDDFIFLTANDGTGAELGGDETGRILPLDANKIPSSAEGWKHITVNLNDSTYTIQDMSGWDVISHMLPKEAGEETWWGGVETLADYQGFGVWSGNINFSEAVSAESNPQFYFELAGTGRTVKMIQGSPGRLVFTDQPGSIPTSNITQFNGEYTITFDANTFTYDISSDCEIQNESKITVMGSSVAKGYGASVASDDFTQYMGYAYHYNKELQERFADGEGYEWEMSNISIGGNTSIDVLGRMNHHLYSGCGKYVIFGLSLANEGIMGGGASVFGQFRDNMLALIDSSRAQNMVPIVVGNYPNGSYSLDDYEYIKDINLLIHQWDVPSINVLGSVDDGSGKWIDGYYSDGGHPNNAGYEEFFHSIVPSLMDALADGKGQPERITGTFLSMGSETAKGMFGLVPEGELHSFTLAFDMRTSNSGTIASLLSGNRRYRMNISETGKLNFAAADMAIKSIKTINDNQWHNIALTQNYANESMVIYIDGKFAGVIEGSVAVDSLLLGDIANAPMNIDFRDWFFYRSGMNTDEISALAGGDMLKSSLELYAPLDGQAVLGSDELINLAQSTNVIKQYDEDNWVGQPINERHYLKIYPVPAGEYLILEKEATVNNDSYEIYNVLGRIEKKGALSGSETFIELNDLPAGIYSLKCGRHHSLFTKQ